MKEGNKPTLFDELAIPVGGYILWITLHLYLLFSADESSSAGNHFWPFSRTDSDYYDLSEFVVYIMVPFVLWVAPVVYSIIEDFKKRNDM